MNFWAVYVVYNPDRAYLEKSLEAVAAQVDGIVIVDNGGGPENADVQKYKALVIRENGNTGIAKALNDGFREAMRNGAECVITFDQDSVPPSDMVEKYREFFISHPMAGEVGCRYSGSQNFDSCRETDHVITSGAAIPSKVFNAVGEFREDYFIDMVDVEYSWRIRKEGWEVWQLSDVILEHHLGDGLGGITLFGKKRLCYVRHNDSRWFHIVRNTMWLTNEYKDIYPENCRKYRRKLARSVFRSLLFDSGRRGILKAVRNAIKDSAEKNVKMQQQP